MYGLVSFKANGDRVEHITLTKDGTVEKPAFYALTINGRIPGLNYYFCTLEALQCARQRLELADAEETAKEVTYPEFFKLAA